MRADLRPFPRIEGTGLRELLREHELAHVVEPGADAQRREPLLVPAQADRDRLGQLRDALRVAGPEGIAIVDCLSESVEHPRRVIPGAPAEPSYFQIPVMGSAPDDRPSQRRPHASSIVRKSP
ncbi:MAG TPA: hypothetical protein VIL56_01675 [Gaiellaceae bacterium]|jgi:hypothetical protein